MTTRTVIGDLRAKGRLLAVATREQIAAYFRETDEIANRLAWDPVQRSTARIEAAFCAVWHKTGGVVYELTHSLAALFAMTSAPSIDWSHTPHQAFVIKVPREFLPARGTIESSDSWILVWSGAFGSAVQYSVSLDDNDLELQRANGAMLIADYDTTADTIMVYEDQVSVEHLERGHKAVRLLNRFVANTLIYVTTHPASIAPKTTNTRASSPNATFVIKPPIDVVIERDFRDAARAAVSATTLVGIRRAMAHVVRGHWRNQATGPQHSERTRTWVRPHKRGDEAMGRVVQRIERLKP